MAFVDKLALFSNKKAETFDLNLSKIIEVYKEKIRINKLNIQKNQEIENQNLQKQDLDRFIGLMLESLRFLQSDENIYHHLDLLLYNLENLNKK